jgi:hypothetical protein
MNAKGRIYMKSLLAKLSAMRVTLGDEERVLLDQMILGSQAEVGAHRSGLAEESLASEPDEVAAHRSALGADEVAAHRSALGADEVVAHRSALGANRTAARGIIIYYDPELEAYQIKD